SRSSARAWASANSGSKFTQALTTGSHAAIRARQSRVTASHVVSPASIFDTISVALNWLRPDASFASMSRSVLAGAAGAGSGNLAEYGAGHQAGTAGIVEVEQAADHFAGRVKSADRLIVGVEHFGIGIDAQTAECERDSAGDGIAFERRRIDRVRPVAFVHSEPLRASAVLDVRVERHIGAHGRVPFFDCP